MIYNLKSAIDCKRSHERLQWLILNQKRIEIKELRKLRTTSQNSYLHLLLSYFALEVGETTDFIKQDVFKKIVNKELFEYERINPKSGKKRIDYRSSASLDTKEMTTAIDRFKMWVTQKTGLVLPEANEGEYLDMIQNEINKNKEYL